MATNRQLFLQHLAKTSDTPLQLEIEKAEGCTLYSPDGTTYLDLISGIGVSNVGHRHPKVVQAIKEQLDKHLHLMVYGEYVQATQVKLAAELAKTLPGNLSSVYFVNSGSEAVEGAAKLAKRYTGRTQLVSFLGAYHGSTHGALSLTGNEALKQSFRPLLPDIKHLPFNQTEALENITNQTAAVFLETIQGEAGVRVPDKEFMKALRARCTQTGSLLILDEIQTGFGRTGTFWAFEQYGIQPDVVVCAKGMGGGMPIGAFISTPEVMKVLSYNPVLGHITTFGGHPVSCAASLATLHVLYEENLIEKVSEKAQLFKTLLQHQAIKQIRNAGLLMAVEFESYSRLKQIIDRAITKGIVTDWFLFCDNSMRIAPPLTITTDEIKKACEIILQAIEETKSIVS